MRRFLRLLPALACGLFFGAPHSHASVLPAATYGKHRFGHPAIVCYVPEAARAGDATAGVVCQRYLRGHGERNARNSDLRGARSRPPRLYI
jgi:hypothetical protein